MRVLPGDVVCLCQGGGASLPGKREAVVSFPSVMLGLEEYHKGQQTRQGWNCVHAPFLSLGNG